MNSLARCCGGDGSSGCRIMFLSNGSPGTMLQWSNTCVQNACPCKEETKRQRWTWRTCVMNSSAPREYTTKAKKPKISVQKRVLLSFGSHCALHVTAYTSRNSWGGWIHQKADLRCNFASPMMLAFHFRNHHHVLGGLPFDVENSYAGYDRYVSAKPDRDQPCPAPNHVQASVQQRFTAKSTTHEVRPR